MYHGIRYTWRALARLREDYGKEWPDRVEDALAHPDPPTLAIMLAAGFPEDDDRSRPDWWMERSPPLGEAQRALGEAMRRALVGPEPPKANPPTPPRLPTWLRRLFKHGAD